MVDYILKSSLNQNKEIIIVYQTKDNITQRKIKVIKIKNDIIEAYCYYRHQIRHFKKENILSAFELAA
jgi:predicted DNA-binding transcriptional regulator YafY